MLFLAQGKCQGAWGRGFLYLSPFLGCSLLALLTGRGSPCCSQHCMSHKPLTSPPGVPFTWKMKATLTFLVCMSQGHNWEGLRLKKKKIEAFFSSCLWKLGMTTFTVSQFRTSGKLFCLNPINLYLNPLCLCLIMRRKERAPFSTN
jgi:hypothetical protein